MRAGLCLVLPALLSAAPPVVQEVRFTTADGYVLEGTFTVPRKVGRRPVVLLAHQFGADRSGWKEVAADLNARGIATLALDLRGHGASLQRNGQPVAIDADYQASSTRVGFDRIPGDLAMVARWLRRQPSVDPRRLALAGSSLGAFSALAAAPQVHPVAVLALSPAGGWVNPSPAYLAGTVQAAPCAVLVLAAEEDLDAAANTRALKGLPGVHARIVGGAQHGFQFLPGVQSLVTGWLGEYLRGRDQGTEAPQR